MLPIILGDAKLAVALWFWLPLDGGPPVPGSVVMKILNATLSALVASSLLAAPIAAQAAPVARTSTPAEGEQLAGFGWGWIFAALIVVGVVLIIVSDSDEDDPVSP